MRIVFDLDGTLADNKHREHFIIATEDRTEPDWDGFFEACDGDAPIWPAIETLCALYSTWDRFTQRNDIEIWSGRGEGEGGSVREKTLKWLPEYTRRKFHIRDMPHATFFYGDTLIDLRMRAHGDHTPDEQLKLAWLKEAHSQGREPQLIFDDRQKVVDMWRAEGIPCFQVAPGNF